MKNIEIIGKDRCNAYKIKKVKIGRIIYPVFSPI